MTPAGADDVNHRSLPSIPCGGLGRPDDAATIGGRPTHGCGGAMIGTIVGASDGRAITP